MILKDFEEFGEPGRMSGPGGTGDEFAISDGIGDVERDEGGTGELDLGAQAG